MDIDKIKEVLSEQGTDISRTWFVCFDGTNVMSSEKAGVQKSIDVKLLSQYM